MSDFAVMLQLMLMMTLIILAGFTARRTRVITPEMLNPLTDLMLKVIVPCNIVDAFLSVERDALSFSIFLQLFLISFAIHLTCLLLGNLLYRRVEESRRSVLRFATLFSNANFFGLPMVSAIYGPQGVLYLSIALIPLRILLWSYGLHLYGGDKGDKSTWHGFLKVLTHPCMLALFIGAALVTVPFDPPRFLAEAIARIGNCVTPLALMLVGAIMAGTTLRGLFDPLVLYMSAVRLVLIPLVSWSVLRFLPVDPLAASICVLMSAMPAASVTAALAARYGSNAAFGAKCVVFSSLLSLLTLPVVRMLLLI